MQMLPKHFIEAPPVQALFKCSCLPSLVTWIVLLTDVRLGVPFYEIL